MSAGSQSTSSDPASDAPTPEQQAYAYLFLNDLATNKPMNDGWTTLLGQLHDQSTMAVSEREEAIDNYLAEWGYDTTAEAVLDLLSGSSTQWWADYLKSKEPNAESDRFVQNVLQDLDLYKAYDTQLTAARSSGSLDSLNSWLTQQNYGCTALQVNASFHKMRDQNMNFWTGIYGDAHLVSQSGGSEVTPAPALIVYGNTNVSLGPIRIYDPQYAQGVLTWGPTSKDGLLHNPCTASLTFSTITAPRDPGDPTSYVGNEFEGTLTYTDAAPNVPAGSYTFTGQIGEPPANQPGHPPVTPPSYDRSNVDAIFKYINYFVMAGMAVQMLAGMYKFGQSALEKFKEWTDKPASEASESAQETDAVPVDKAQVEDSTAVEELKADEGATPEEVQQEETAAAEEEQQAEEAEEEAESGEEDGADGDGETVEEELEETAEEGI